MSQNETSLYRRALGELGAVFDRVDESAVDRAVQMLAEAKTVMVYACGREGLAVRGLAMRLFHLGRRVAVVGDMTAPPLGAGDLFFVVCGPGEVSTSVALVGVAKQAGAKVLVVTAQPQGRVPLMADFVLTVPAQTLADDRGPSLSVLPMGSLFEGALFVLFEIIIIKLRDLLGVTPEAMRANHTNME
jgi:6-phospho-3-hexuloisomerase